MTPNKDYQKPKYERARFVGIGAIYPVGPEKARAFIHPNAVSIWSGRMG